MPTNRHPIRHPHRGRLNYAQEMVLRYGEDPRWADAFHGEPEQLDAWMRNRDHLLASYKHGRRPAAWWRFESPIKYPGYDVEQSTLFAAGLLTEEESAALLVWWHDEFERAQPPDFMFCNGPASWLRGSAARRAHYRWADIPRELVREWTVERRRRGKTIHKLETAAAEQPVPAA